MGGPENDNLPLLYVMKMSLCRGWGGGVLKSLKTPLRNIKMVPKGQLISKCLYEIIVWTKIQTKFFLVSALALSGQKLSNFCWYFGPNEDFKKTF